MYYVMCMRCLYYNKFRGKEFKLYVGDDGEFQKILRRKMFLFFCQYDDRFRMKYGQKNID